MIEPTWQSKCGRAKLWLDDCTKIMPRIKADAIITDPPYGIDFEYDEYNDTLENWFELMKKFVPLAQTISQAVVMPACDQNRLDWWYENFKPKWLICWYKGSPGHLSNIGFNCWEAHLFWGKQPKPVHDFFQTPLTTQSNGHPCPKPIGWSNWLVSNFCLENKTVLDPFMGSGTTGVSSVMSNRRYIGIERSPKYFEISKQRIITAISKKKRSFDLKAKKLTRNTLIDMKKKLKRKKA